MIVAVDVGSGSVRAGLVAPEGVVHVARRPGPLALVPGLLLGLDLGDLRRRVSDALVEVAELAAGLGARIDLLTCTSVRYATVWHGGDEELSWANLARAERSDVEDAQASMSRTDLVALGGWPTPLSLSTRLQTAQRNGTSPSEQTVPLSVAGWLLCSWGADPHVDDVTWADNRVSAARLAGRVRVVSPGTVVGEYDGSVAGTERWRGARLAVAPPDTVAALHGIGPLAVGDAVAIAGTTTPVVAVADISAAGVVRQADDHSWLPFTPDRVLAESNAARTGEVVAAMSRLLAPDESSPEATPAGEPMGTVRSFLGPTLAPPRMLGRAVAPQGIEFDEPFPGISPRRLRHSAIEANAWATDLQLRRVEAQAGVTGRRIVCGGQTRSSSFLDLLAAAGERELEAIADEVTLLGAAAAASGRPLPPPEVRRVSPDHRIGDEPARWAARWWHRYDMLAVGERAH